MLCLTTIRYVSVILHSQLLCCSSYTYVCMYVPVVAWLPAHWPCMCTYHIVQHVSEGASNDAVNGCDHLTSRVSAGPTQSNVEVRTCLHLVYMPTYVVIGSLGIPVMLPLPVSFLVVVMHVNCIPRTLRYNNIRMEVLIMLPKGATLHT